MNLENMKIFIDGKEMTGQKGQTILQVAEANGIEIPTLCYDERTEIYGSCGLCVVEVEGNPKLVKACAMMIAEGMNVNTRTERVLESRKMNLQLLLSNHVGDCRPPCMLNCPAQTDCQGYVGLIANGEFERAIEVIQDKIPLPASIGRVCPHPCMDNCRRALIEEPISIAWLKRFAADVTRESGNPFMPKIANDSGKKVAVIGGGPYGLSVAYFLRAKGHQVTIYDAMPKLGGMLRYGIPQYRLPKEVLDEEIALIEQMGVVLKPNTKIGTDISFEEIRKNNDAVCVGIGAWVSTGVGCEGDDAEGVIGGIDFLRKVVRGEEHGMGETVAVVGGGNTAMDACRTAIRLGAKKVYNIYRRTKDEMPADAIEIIEGEEEGVIFKNLVSPIEIIKGEDGKVSKMVLQVMELGEAGSDGRRVPVAIEGKTETIEIDTVIAAIGQAVDSDPFGDLEKTRKKGISYDKETFMTSMEGVFAGGDCGNDKISIAIEAIADAQKSSEIIHRYLAGEKIAYRRQYTVQRDDLTAESFEDRERMFAPEMKHLKPEDRRSNFEEIVKGFTIEQAMKEADRCLECGCHDYFECKLIDYANEYKIDKLPFEGDINASEDHDPNPYILREPSKCILCGQCVRVCNEVVGAGVLGFVDRGFDTVVAPALGKTMEEAGCVFCGQCVDVCPTGALGEKLKIKKSVPVEGIKTDTTCTQCPVGCQIHLESCGDMLIKATANKQGKLNNGLLCKVGKFEYDYATREGKLFKPQIKNSGSFDETNYETALTRIKDSVKAAASDYGKEAIAVAVAERYTNEEKAAAKELADKIGARMIFIGTESGLEVKERILNPIKNQEKSLKGDLNGVKAVLLLGDEPQQEALDGIAVIMMAGSHMTDVAKMANVVIPGTGYVSAKGTFTNVEGITYDVNPAIDEKVEMNNEEMLKALAERF